MRPHAIARDNRTWALFGERAGANGEEDVLGIFTGAPPTQQETTETILRLPLYHYCNFRTQAYGPKTPIENLRGRRPRNTKTRTEEEEIAEA